MPNCSNGIGSYFRRTRSWQSTCTPAGRACPRTISSLKTSFIQSGICWHKELGTNPFSELYNWFVRPSDITFSSPSAQSSSERYSSTPNRFGPHSRFIIKLVFIIFIVWIGFFRIVCLFPDQTGFILHQQLSSRNAASKILVLKWIYLTLNFIKSS